MQIHSSLDPARSGSDNMAIDQQMLEKSDRDRQCYLRLYRWSEPTLSLGHFQRWEDRASHPSSANIAAVKRASGGGAIVHDLEWTYAVAMPQLGHRLGASNDLYDTLHDCLVQLLRYSGWDARKWSKADQTACPSHQTPTPQPFLCFQRRSCGDIVIGEHKVVGSAQRRLGTSVLQHGSILWRASPAAPELLGIHNLGHLPESASECHPTLLAKKINGVFLPKSEHAWLDFGAALLSWLEWNLMEKDKRVRQAV